MKYYFAPMEGVTGAEFRRAHHQVFGGVDAYYMPFLSPTQDHVFTPRSSGFTGKQPRLRRPQRSPEVEVSLAAGELRPWL